MVLAFAGVVTLFSRGWEGAGGGTMAGDLMLLAGGALWGVAILYIKRFLAPRALPLQTLFYQLIFSAPLLFALSLALEDSLWYGWSLEVELSLVYQCLVVVFLSYLAWFELIHRYQVSILSAFTFFTPIFGVFLSGVLLLGEGLSLPLVSALTLVSAGMILVNWPRGAP